MKKIVGFLFVFIIISVIAHAGETKPLQLSLFNPVQIVNEDTSIKGLRLDLLYGVNDNVAGIDFGIVNRDKGKGCGLQLGVVNRVSCSFYGYQRSIFNVVEENFIGIQLGEVGNYVKGDYLGYQSGVVNITKDGFKGFQLGLLYNYAETMNGLQLGLINVAGDLNGIQIGLININKKKDPLGFFPIINFSF